MLAKLPALLFLLMLLACVLLSVFFLYQGARQVVSAAAEAEKVLVIDPGHGGIDGGALSVDGCKESDLNLLIGRKLQYMAELIGQRSVMTRSDDGGGGSYGDYSEHENLVSRCAFVEGIPNAVLISIHQNSFPTSQPSGVQVLYAATPGSDSLGKRCHQNLISLLDPENRRLAAPAPKSLYLTSHVSCPAILVECGFMSNPFEVLKLRSDAYQSSIALILLGSLIQTLSENEYL